MTNPEPNQPPCIHLPVQTILRFLVMISVLLCLIGFGAHYCIYHIAEDPDSNFGSLMQRFDLGFEPSIPGYFSSVLMLISSVLLWVIFQINQNESKSQRVYWFSLSLIFLYLSVDEAVMIHEMADGALQRWLQTSGVFFLAWVIPAIVVVTIVGACYIPFLCSLDRQTRNLFILAGSVFVGGAIGMEMAASKIVEANELSSLKYAIFQTVEEGMEMIGVLIFIAALAGYIRKKTKEITFAIVEN